MPQGSTTVTKTKTRTAIKVGIGLAALGALAYLFMGPLQLQQSFRQGQRAVREGRVIRRLPDFVIQEPRLMSDHLIFTISNIGDSFEYAGPVSGVSYQVEWLREDYTPVSPNPDFRVRFHCVTCIGGLQYSGGTTVVDTGISSSLGSSEINSLITNQPPSARYFRIHVDPGNTVEESHDENNKAILSRFREGHVE